MAKVLPTKKTERAGVNQFRSLLESAGHIVQEIDGGNDYGEDCYLSFTEYGQRTGDIAAVQIKSGVTYRRDTGYAIPCRDHVNDWSQSRIPVIGVVWDPEIRKLYWVNLTRYLRQELAQGKHPRSVPIDEHAILDQNTIKAVTQEMRRYIARDDHSHRQGPSPALGLAAAVRRYRNRNSNEIESPAQGGKAMPHAAAQVEFIDRHPHLIDNTMKWLVRTVTAAVLAMMIPGLYTVVAGQYPHLWPLWFPAYFGMVGYMLRVGEQVGEARHIKWVRYAAYVLILSGWYVALGTELHGWSPNRTFCWVFVVEVPVLAQFALLKIMFCLYGRERARRRRLAAAYGDATREVGAEG
ncbi:MULTISPECIES: DUF4365 domain-containing protein [Streptacidiphilus]|uniref:DUF4365 domain-containing protein n=1 Tax=Streptacidiphilus cavernicola TaxID=3342716 RepID=A0ABV6V0J7_9ACTN|nr:DUF4365 domain-containing protein [Streptacidiphilus jeojiense]